MVSLAGAGGFAISCVCAGARFFMDRRGGIQCREGKSRRPLDFCDGGCHIVAVHREMVPGAT